MSGTRVISTTSRRELSSSFLQDKEPKEIHAILTETLACFLPGRAKDLSAPLYVDKSFILSMVQCQMEIDIVLIKNVIHVKCRFS